MPLIKETNAELVKHEAVVLDLGDLRRVAERMAADAEAKAQQIIADAQAEAQRLTSGAAEAGRKQGLAAGHAEGLERGREQGKAEALAGMNEQLGALIARWGQTLDQFEADRRQMLIDARQSVLELALAMGEKVARRVPQVDPTVVVDQVAEAVDRMARPADVTVRVNPADVPLVTVSMPSLVERIGTLEHVHIADDEQIERGGCVVTYGRGRIDATLDTQLARMVELLLPVSKHSEPIVEEPADAGPATEGDA